MTTKDRSDLDAALNEGVDWIAVSFVQRADDVAEVKKIARGRALVLAKIEKPQAIARLDEIIEMSDALMVARGDLGVEMPLEKVPGLQKRITRMSRRQGKPVVVATQMLESMISSPVPTRAEVSDVAQAVFEGADAVMLSAESASGQFPVEAVATMNRIAEEVERDPLYPGIIAAQRDRPEPTGADAIAFATRDVAETLDLKAVVAWTASGSTGFASRGSVPSCRSWRSRRPATRPAGSVSPGGASGRDRGRAQRGRHGGPRLPDGIRRRVRRVGRARHRRGRHSVRFAGRDQYDAHRVRGAERRDVTTRSSGSGRSERGRAADQVLGGVEGSRIAPVASRRSTTACWRRSCTGVVTTSRSTMCRRCSSSLR